MQLNLKSKHRQRVGKKIHKTQQNIFRRHTRRAELLALSQQGSNPAKFQQERKGTSRIFIRVFYNSQRIQNHVNMFLGIRSVLNT